MSFAITIGTLDDLEAVPKALPILESIGERSKCSAVEAAAKVYMGRPDCLWLVAKLDDVVVGTVLAQVRTEGVMIERVDVFVDVIAVVPEERGTGVGERLLLVTENWAQRKGADGVLLGVPTKTPWQVPEGYEVLETIYRKKV